MSNLKEAISYIYDIEKNNYFMTRAIFQLAAESSKPRVEKEIKVDTKGLQEPKEPSMPVDHCMPSKPQFSRDDFSWKAWMIGSAVIAFILTVIVAGITTGMNTAKLEEGNNGLIVGFGYIIGFIVCLIFKPIFELISGHRYYKQECKAYQMDMEALVRCTHRASQ